VDYLSADEQLNLDPAFDELRGGLHFVNALKNPARMPQAKSLIERAYTAYTKQELPEASAAIRELERHLGFGVGSGRGCGDPA